MKAKNEKEINNAFFQFLLLFLLTVTIVVGAVFFDYGFPWVHYNKLKIQASESRGLLQNKNEEFNIVSSIINQINGFDDPSASKTLIETNVKKGLEKLSSFNSNGNSKIDSLLVICLSTMLDNKKLISQTNDNLKKKDADLMESNSQRDAFKTDKEKCEDDYNAFISSRK